MTRLCAVRFLSAVRAVAARCKLPLPSAQACPKTKLCAPRKIQKRVGQAGVTNGGDQQKEAHPVPYSSSTDAIKEGVGRNSSGSSPAPGSSASASLLFPLPELPELPFRRLAPYVLLGWYSPFHVCRSEKVQLRPAAPLVRQGSRILHRLFQLPVSFPPPCTGYSAAASTRGTP